MKLFVVALLCGEGLTHPARSHAADSTASALLASDDDPTTPELGLPIFNLGLPKSGSTSSFSFFSCGGYTPSSHWTCNEELCGICSHRNFINGEQLFHGCGHYKMYGEVDYPGSWGQDQTHNPSPPGPALPPPPPKALEGACFFPQVQALDKIHQQFPQATFLLPTRDPHRWVESVIKDHNMKDKFIDCDLPDLPLGVGGKDADLISFYQIHSDKVRAFAAKTGHKLIEWNIEDDIDEVGQFLQEQTGVKAECWGQSNSASTNGNDVNQPAPVKSRLDLLLNSETFHAFHAVGVKL